MQNQTHECPRKASNEFVSNKFTLAYIRPVDPNAKFDWVKFQEDLSEFEDLLIQKVAERFNPNANRIDG